MSRSYKKRNYCGNAGASDKQGKRLANRAFRRQEHMALKTLKFSNLPMHLNDVSNVWGFPKDGKHYFGYMKYENELWLNELFLKLKRK